MSWFQTLGIKLQKVSNIIHQKTLRGGANFMVVSPKVATILESIPGFAADSAGDASKYAHGCSENWCYQQQIHSLQEPIHA
jgi:hypothetical protein